MRRTVSPSSLWARPARRARLAALALLAFLCSVPDAGLAQEQNAAAPAPVVPTAGVTRPARPAKRHRRARRARAEAPLRFSQPTGEAALASDIGSLLTARVRSGEWGVMVVSLTRGDTLFALNAGASLKPASNMKLFTTALALDQFGATHEFSTDVLRSGTLAGDGTLQGDLVLRGGGDPGMSRRYFGTGSAGGMDSLAALVAAAGVRRVTGGLIADASAFDPQRIPEGWLTRNLQASYSARVSALALNDGLATIVINPGRAGRAAAVSLEPAADIRLSSSVRTVAGRSARISAHSTPDGGIAVSGRIGVRAGQRSYVVVVEDPTAYTAAVFRRALETHGVRVAGPTRYAPTPAPAARVASLSSAPLADLLAAMNGESINLFAELLFRDAARNVSPSGVGSAEGGSRLLQTFLADKVGVAPGAVFAADGSGLSVLDRVTARSLVKLLSYSQRAQWSDAFLGSLPVAGETDLLRRRMRSTPAQGNLRAKTGTTNSVISLGGYVTSRDGEQLAFAFIYNGTDRWHAKETIDAMGATLASFER